MIDLHTVKYKTDPPPPDDRSNPPTDSEQMEDASIWAGWQGQSVMAFGVLLPAVTIIATGLLQAEAIWHLMLRHPLETLLQAAFVIGIPLANLLVWRAIVHKDGRNPLRLGLLNGFSTGISSCIFAITAAAVYLGSPTYDAAGAPHPATFLAICSFSLLAVCSGLFLVDQLRRSRETRKARQLSLLFSLSGALLSVLFLGLSEARSAYFRYFETLATADSNQQKQEGLNALRNMDAELALRLECADPRTAGLSGLFFHIDGNSLKQLYFGVAGKPYRDGKSTNVTSMSDDYLKRHMVGTLTPGLSLVRSAITGTVNSNTFSSRLEWTFVFKNKTPQAQEARAELAIPNGTVISGLTLWMDGKPQQANFAVTDRAHGAYKLVTVSHRDPALVTDLGHGRYLLQCSSVPAQGELKVSLGITAPLKPHSADEATLTLPRLQDQNFALPAQQKIALKSSAHMTVSLNELRQTTHDGVWLLSGTVKAQKLAGTPISILVGCDADRAPLVVRDIGVRQHGFVVQQIEKAKADIPRSLIVVLDGSKSMQSHCAEVKEALASIPENIATRVIVAKDGVSQEPLPLEEGLAQLHEASFLGGEDNLPAMIKAAEEAGQDRESAVLWIHGPQPSLNQEMYIINPLNSQPSFYELALDNGTMDANEFFRNHAEIGPFTTIDRGGTVREDLSRFFAGWQPGSFAYKVKYWASATKPSFPGGTGSVEEQETELARAVSNLRAISTVDSLLAKGKNDAAARLAVSHHLVTAVTGAIVLETTNDDKLFGLTDQNARGPETSTSTSTNGSAAQYPVQPQAASDATEISGIHTAGAVRVNNLANLEALLNIVANGSEIVFMLFGIFNSAVGLAGKSMRYPFRLSAGMRIAFGCALIALGLAVPGMINWMVASARDANLFD